MATQAHVVHFLAPAGTHTATWHLTWFAIVSAVSFIIPFTLTSMADIHHDLYYLIYFSVTLLLLTVYVRASGVDVATWLSTRWQWSLAIGAVAAAFVVWSVLARIDSTPHPDGAYFVFQIFWRGLVYGVVDALLLSAFPGLVALALFGNNLKGLARKAGDGALTFLLVFVITGVYHLGYEDLRDRDIIQPEFGNAVISLPVILTANPVGSIVAHTSMHLAAVTHSYESEDRLPPQVLIDD